MKNLHSLAILVLALSGCASWNRSPPAGAPVEAVLSELGQPTARYRDGADTMLEYASGPSGQQTYMARIGADGRLISYEQVLNSAKFATVQIGKDNEASILRTFGRPAETYTLPLKDLHVWAYRYKEADVWNSMMHVHFDRDGVVRMMVSGPDPEREERRR